MKIPLRQASLALDVASGDRLDVRELTVHERISSLYSASVTAVAANPDIDFDAIVGLPARFEVRAGLGGTEHVRAWTGICKEVQERAAEETGLSTYTVEIVPLLWLATQRRNHRMFQHRSDLEIVLELMAEWGVVPVPKLTGSYKKRKYRVQYGESDYAFMCRLLEDSGISFFFEAIAGETVLVLSDAPEMNIPRLPPITFHDRPGDVDREHVTKVCAGRRVRPGRYTLRDHDYRRPASYPLVGTAAGASMIEQRLERFHYTPGAFLFESDQGDGTPTADDQGCYRADEGAGGAIARRRLDAQRSEALSFTFETNAIDLAPGVVFGMLGHPRRDLGDDKRLLVVESTMTARVGQSWTVRCEARSAQSSYRPPLATAKPKVVGVESATVVGPKGDEIHTDEFGRVRVHFHWDRESKMDDKSSCWIHVSQPWGGSGFGGVNLPRVGQEVLVDFLGGDPDRPIIVGRVYTNLQKVPYGLPDNKTQSGWKSNSTDATGGYNELMFEDKAGKELVRMQAERDLHKLVKHDEDDTIGRNRATQVVENDSIVVGQNQRITVGVNRTATVGSVDTTTAGEKHVVAIVPSSNGASTTSSITMTDGEIVLDARVIRIVARDYMELRGEKRGIDLKAPAPEGKIKPSAGDKLEVNSPEVALSGDNVKITATASLGLNAPNVEIGGNKVDIVAGTLCLDGGKVFINGPGRPAARKDDLAAGIISQGSPTVFIGDGGAAPGSPAGDIALAPEGAGSRLYDPVTGQLTSNETNGPPHKLTQYTYDDEGNLTGVTQTTTYEGGSKVVQQYDGSMKPTTTEEIDNNDNVASRTKHDTLMGGPETEHYPPPDDGTHASGTGEANNAEKPKGRGWFE